MANYLAGLLIRQKEKKGLRHAKKVYKWLFTKKFKDDVELKTDTDNELELYGNEDIIVELV